MTNGFVAKLNNGLTTLIQSTYLGGSDVDLSNGIAVDRSGNVFVTGYSFSADFPGTASGVQPSDFHSHAFVAKLNPNLAERLNMQLRFPICQQRRLSRKRRNGVGERIAGFQRVPLDDVDECKLDDDNDPV